MNNSAFALALLVVVAAPLSAQTPAQAPAKAAPAPEADKLTIDSPIEKIVARPEGKQAIEANFPGMTSHPAFDQFKAMSLKQIQPMSNGMITDEAITKTAEALAAIK
jgi:hypothetical protein